MATFRQTRLGQYKDRNLRGLPLLGMLLLLVSCFSLSGTMAPPQPLRQTDGTLSGSTAAPLGEPEPLIFQQIAIEEAERLNAAVPTVAGAILSAAPFNMGLSGQNFATRMTALDCLTAAIYYEAASETLTGQRAVAQVVLNRVRHPAYPNSVCGVVYQGSERKTGCQFTFTCDGALSRKPSPALWQRATGIAAAALAGYVEHSVGTATHYHTNWVVPYWRTSLTKLTMIGTHIFYRWNGSTGAPSAFTQAYAGLESFPKSLNSAVAAALPVDPALGSESDLALLAQRLQPQTVAASEPVSRLPSRAALSADETRVRLVADENRGTLIVGGSTEISGP